MTTGTGINAYDPIHKKPYIILGADSKAIPCSISGKLYTKKSFDAKKIIALKNSNLLFVHAGEFMDPNHLQIDQIQKQKELAFLNSTNITKQQAYFHLKRISNLAKRAYILSFHTPLEMYLFERNGETIQIASTMIGSGAEYCGEHFNKTIAEKTADKKTGLPIITLKEALSHTLNEINQASQKDFGTGGKFQFSISTEKSYMQISEAVKFRKNLNPQKNIKKIENEILQNLNQPHLNSLEDILF